MDTMGSHRCPEQTSFWDFITSTCIDCSTVCDEPFGTAEECDRYCPGYIADSQALIAPVTLVTQVTTVVPSGLALHAGYVTAAAATAVALSAGILICAVLVRREWTTPATPWKDGSNGDGIGELDLNTSLVGKDVRSGRLDPNRTSISSNHAESIFSSQMRKEAHRVTPAQPVPAVTKERTDENSYTPGRVRDTGLISVSDFSLNLEPDSELIQFPDTVLTIDLDTSLQTQSDNHAESVISLYQNMESITKRYPWILGCLISSDHLEVLVDLQKAGCSINAAYEKIRCELGTDREQYFVVTVQTGEAALSHS